jgi:hypothetical protein
MPLGVAVALAAALLALAPLPAAAQLPIFDAHIHYSRPDWDVYTPELALSILARAGVHRAIVSSTPDDGTLKLYERAPRGIVPFLRPYRTREDMSGWARDPSVAACVEKRLARGVYRGIGEFHLSASEVDAPVVRRIAELAAAAASRGSGWIWRCAPTWPPAARSIPSGARFLSVTRTVSCWAPTRG